VAIEQGLYHDGAALYLFVMDPVRASPGIHEYCDDMRGPAIGNELEHERTGFKGEKKPRIAGFF
jgi:hypothetical protein